MQNEDGPPIGVETVQFAQDPFALRDGARHENLRGVSRASQAPFRPGVAMRPLPSAQVTAVIVTYNSRDVVGEALSALQRGYQRGLVECIVVDNGSADGSAAFVRESFPWVTVVEGHGRLTADGAVSVNGDTLRGRGTIICAGSVPRSIPGMDIDGRAVVTSDHATNSDAQQLPERVVVVGGGVIGAEFASVYTDMGVQTTLLEALDHGVLPIGPDRDVADVLARSLKKRGTTIHAQAGSMYRKLGVSSRSEAVARCRELALLDA